MERQYPMKLSWKLLFLVTGSIGLVCLGCGLLDLFGSALEETQFGFQSDTERWIVIVTGAVLLPFSITGLLHARMEISQGEIRYLRFHVACTTGVIPLSEIRRLGAGIVRRSRGRRDHILLMEQADSRTNSIKLSMYSGAANLPEQLAEKLGQKLQATTDNWLGLRFEEPSAS